MAQSKAREEEFHLAFSRAKEQTEAREQYFGDLKQQFDEMRQAYDRDLAQAREVCLDVTSRAVTCLYVTAPRGPPNPPTKNIYITTSIL